MFNFFSEDVDANKLAAEQCTPPYKKGLIKRLSRGDPPSLSSIDNVDTCTLCSKSFGWFVTKTICMACGRVFCPKCCPEKLMLFGNSEDVCLVCYLALDNGKELSKISIVNRVPLDNTSEVRGAETEVVKETFATSQTVSGTTSNKHDVRSSKAPVSREARNVFASPDTNPIVVTSTQTSEKSSCNDDPYEQRRLDEKSYVQSVNTTDIGPGKSWYLIDESWLRSWREFTNPSIRGRIPGKISNNRLLLPNGEPRHNLTTPRYYRGVNEDVWNYLLNIYGGGPEISRPALDIYVKNFKKKG